MKETISLQYINKDKLKFMKYTIFPFFIFMPVILFFFPSDALSAHPLLKKIIIVHNIKAQKKSLADNSYRGEEGVLGIRPERGRVFGMKVFIDQDYLDSRELFKRAGKALKKARRAMASGNKKKSREEYEREIAEYFLLYKKNTEKANKMLMAYHSRLSPDMDDRLSEVISSRIMDKLLNESLKKTGNRLRDALGRFYNLCKGFRKKEADLTPRNISFVNDVFNRFIQQVSRETLDMFILDMDNVYRDRRLPYKWKNALDRGGSKYIQPLEAALKKTRNKIYEVDPLLFMALMRRESNFDYLSISHVGAAGLTQIMPKTARKLGMKKIFMPDYFIEAGSLLKRERKARKEAISALFSITEKDKIRPAARARKLMQKSISLGRKKEKLLSRYKRALKKKLDDDRLQPALAIEYGLVYFAGLLKDQKGDISLALASYNAGPHRVREFNGIPPYGETIRFRNRVLEFYRDYLNKAKGAL